jgi:hypothetical protein
MAATATSVPIVIAKQTSTTTNFFKMMPSDAVNAPGIELRVPIGTSTPLTAPVGQSQDTSAISWKIALGVVLALLLFVVCAAAWFLLRRKKKKKKTQASITSSGDQHTNIIPYNELPEIEGKLIETPVAINPTTATMVTPETMVTTTVISSATTTIEPPVAVSELPSTRDREVHELGDGQPLFSTKELPT